MTILRSLSVAAVTLAVITLATAAPKPLLMRQTNSGDVSTVLGRTFTLAGKTSSASCVDSIALLRQSAFAGSKLSSFIDSLEGNGTEIVAPFTGLITIVRYPDISVNGNSCSGDGEVSLASPSTLGTLAALAPSLEGLDGTGLLSLGDTSRAIAEVTSQFGVAVGSNLDADECNGVKLPAGYAWLTDLAGVVPMVASAAGISDAKKGDLYLVTVAAVPENPANLISGIEPLCVFKLGGSSPDSSASPGAKYRPSPGATKGGPRGSPVATKSGQSGPPVASKGGPRGSPVASKSGPRGSPVASKSGPRGSYSDGHRPCP